MDKILMEASLINDGFSEEEAEMTAEDWDRQFKDDPDFQD